METTTRPPYAAYAGILATYAGLVAGVGALARVLRRDPEDHSPLDLALLGAATFKASRTLTRDQVTSFIREPFVEGDAYSGDDEEPAGDGLRRAVGELITCSRCAGTWVATGLTSLQLLAPRFGRVITWSLAAGAINDWLQAGFTALTSKANDLEERTA